MNIKTPQEILLNATLVTADNQAQIFEFILDDTLSATECVCVKSLANGVVCPIPNFKETMKGTLFELNHVRVNPKLDNEAMLQALTHALEDIGVKVFNPPNRNDMAMCFKPLGELSENVRFFSESDGKLVFLAPTRHLKVIHSNLPKDSPPSNVIQF